MSVPSTHCYLILPIDTQLYLVAPVIVETAPYLLCVLSVCSHHTSAVRFFYLCWGDQTAPSSRPIFLAYNGVFFCIKLFRFPPLLASQVFKSGFTFIPHLLLSCFLSLMKMQSSSDLSQRLTTLWFFPFFSYLFGFCGESIFIWRRGLPSQQSSKGGGTKFVVTNLVRKSRPNFNSHLKDFDQLFPVSPPHMISSFFKGFVRLNYWESYARTIFLLIKKSKQNGCIKYFPSISCLQEILTGNKHNAGGALCSMKSTKHT